ncbi:MAG: copper resistance protein CopC [Actinomycetota bacterium]
MRWKSVIIAVMLGFGIALTGISFAQGVEVLSTSPEVDAKVSVTPNFVTVTADQELLDFGNQLTVISPSNQRVDDGLITVSGATLSVGINQLTESGDYLVEYEILVENESPLFGNFSFTFEAPPVVQPNTPSPSPSASEDGREVGSSTTDYLVIALLIFAFFVLMWLATLLAQPFARNSRDKPK